MHWSFLATETLKLFFDILDELVQCLPAFMGPASLPEHCYQLMSQVQNTGVVFTTPNALPGEGTSQSTSVDGSDAGVGSSGVANRAASINQLGNLSCTAIGVEESICLQ
ncbi:hypothetical protein OIU74_026935 [Salix koriyanagi]|uniref:Uncharacterized protein n=1 Tax=Salix koriyanagi TaxID=2511006 RepID=A0A9Q0VZB7_9ROSI|nr:hypothetical protein OIU74_026935 [Salix koriyanagi]